MLVIFVNTPLFSILMQLYKIRLAYFHRKDISGLYSLHSFNQLIQIILIIFLFGHKSKINFCRFVDVINVIQTRPKLVSLKSSVGMIKLLFIIPTVNRNVLTLEIINSSLLQPSVIAYLSFEVNETVRK